jgi:flagellar motility protein MotE (MotC chaperone)
MIRRVLALLLVGGLCSSMMTGLWAEEHAKPEGGHDAKAAEGKAAEGANSDAGLPTEAPQLKQDRVFTETESQLLLELDRQRIELDRRAQALELREKLVDLMQQRLNQRVGELQQMKADLEKLLQSVSGRDDKELQKLANMYAAMKPTAAAPVLDKLENTVVVDILTRMPVKKSGKIMEALDPIKARVVSEIMSSRTNPPAVKDAVSSTTAKK